MTAILTEVPTKMEIVKIADLKTGEYQVWSKMTEEKFTQFIDGIADNGIDNPIHIDENNVILDGHHRYEAAKQLGLAEIEAKIHRDLTEEEKLGKAHFLNTQTREISREEKIERALALREEGRSYRQIGEWLGVGKSTVERWTSVFSQVPDGTSEKTEGSDGKQYDTKRRSPEEVAERRQSVKQARDEGKKIAEIAEETGVSVGTVHSDIKSIDREEKQAEKKREQQKQRQELDLLEFETQLLEESSPQHREDESLTSPDNSLIDGRKTAMSASTKIAGLFNTVGKASDNVRESYLKQVKSAVESGLITMGQYAESERDQEVVYMCLQMIKNLGNYEEE
jgi:ParB/RepB/Spo0J family partition protein